MDADFPALPAPARCPHGVSSPARGCALCRVSVGRPTAASPPAPRSPGPRQPTLRGDFLNMWFPLPAALRCPIIGCTNVYAGNSEGQRRASLMRHLQRTHSLGSVTSQWRCQRCSQVVPKPKLHP